MKRLLIIICFIVSVFIYATAPFGYSMTSTVLSTVVFLLSALLTLLNNSRYTILRFEVFFTIAVFFTNYIYSLYYFPINPYFSLFNLPFNEGYLSKGIALSSVGMTSFYLGVFDKRNERIIKERLRATRFKSPSSIVFIMMLVFIPYMISLVNRHEYTTEFESNLVNVILVYLVYFSIFIIFLSSRKTNSLLSFLKNNYNNVIMYIIILYMVTFLLVGSRTIPLRIGLIVLFFFSVFISPIKSTRVALFIVLVALLFSFLGVERMGSDYSFSEISSVLDLGEDLTINNRSLYVLMEYADNNGFTYGRTMLMGVLSIIPFGQRIVLALMNWPVSKISSGALVTSLYFDNNLGDRIGLGTNVIGDVYVAFGLIGVIVLMYLLGRLISWMYNQACKGSLLYTLLYGIVFMDSIYFARSSYLTSARSIVWVALIYMIFSIKKPSSNHT